MNESDRDRRQGRISDYFLGVVLLFVVAVFDWWTGPDLSFALIYLVPTTVVAWRAGRIPGVAAGVASTGVWLAIELQWHRRYSHPLVPYTNALLQLGVTVFTAILTAAVSERERELQIEIGVRKETEAKLSALNETLEVRVAERSAAAEKRAEELGRSEASLRRQTSVLRSILTNMGDGVIVTDQAGRIRLYNPAGARLLHLAVGKAKDSEWIEDSGLFLLDTLATYSSADGIVLSALGGKQIDGLELRSTSVGQAGESWLSLTARPLIDDLGMLHGVVFVVSDATARKEMEKLVADVSEREQQRIGQDLHDGLGQHLVSTAFATTMLRDKLMSKGLPEAKDASEIAGLINSAITQSRDLARGLYPVKLEEEGLSSALEELAVNLSRLFNVNCRFQCNRSAAVYDARVGSNLFRLAQEAVNNAVKHGRANNILIQLDQREGSVLLTVSNDGMKFATPGPNERGMGLRIMNYRARMMGADLKISAGTESGTVVLCRVPNLKLQTSENVNAQRT